GTVGTVRPHLSVHVTLTELERLSRDGSPNGRPPRGFGGHIGPAGPAGPAAPGGPGGSMGPGGPSGSVGPTAPSGPSGPSGPGGSGGRVGPGGIDGAIDLAALVTAPPAEWEDGRGPVPEPVLRRLAADSEVTRVVFGPDSQVIDVGRAARTFTGHLRRAVVARDRECVVDGCGAPPSIGQIHHAVTRWADGGITSIDNAALVCAFHNQWLEDYQVPMRWISAPDGRGRWELGKPGTYRPPPPPYSRRRSVISRDRGGDGRDGADAGDGREGAG